MFGCVVALAVVAGAFSGGGVAVGWYSVGMWLFVGLGVLLLSFLHVLSQWPLLCQWLQNTVCAVMSHMTLVSTFEACWSISVV